MKTKMNHPFGTTRNSVKGWTAVLCIVFTGLFDGAVAQCGEWKAGAAKVTITPSESMWMSGYGSRDRPSQGTLHDLWCKALAIEDPQGTRAALITLDLCGVSKSVSDVVCERLQKRLSLERAAIMMACSHTHTGPMVENNLETMFDLSVDERRKITEYTRALEKKIEGVTAEAFEKLEPARLAWANGTATFAVNRRNNPEAKVPELRQRGELKGPVDHEVAVLSVRTLEGELKAIVFGYACHATVLSSYEWSGDFPGFAQIEVEKTNPGTVALFFTGCGADQNPVPRRNVEQAEQYGRELAGSVNQVLRGAMNQVGDRLSLQYKLLDLPFDTLPTVEDLKKHVAGSNQYEARRARKLLAEIERKGRLETVYPYPIQIWRLGTQSDALTWIALGGEVTVGYSLRLKRELGPGHTWVAGYANDVMAYIPTRRVWEEGGYEGAGAMVYYGLPTRWSGDVEEIIVRQVHRMLNAR